ncbi:MAG: sodium:solute symporter family protein [Planctomycetes bacterium]|nr:sodium:solute symporter family protein [Planctomycetota bacterium]
MEYTPYVVLAFLLAMTVLGAWHARRVKSADDFALAGRGLSGWVLCGTLIATWIGTGSIFSNAEFTYDNGIVGLFLPISGAVGMLFLAWVAPRVRNLPAASVPQILGLRFGKPAQKLGAVALLGAYLIIISYQYRAGAAVAERLFPGMDLSFGEPENPQSWWPILFAVFVILYTALAGMVSVAITDVANGVVMTIGILFGLGLLFMDWDPVTQPMPETHLRIAGALTGIKWINIMLPSFLLILGDANLMQRFLAAKSPATAKRAALGAFVGLVILESAIIGLALMGKMMLPEAPENTAHVIIDTAFQLMPAVIGTLLAAAVVAIIISTADSFLLACSTTAATDLGGGMTTPRKQRVLVIVLGLVALGLAFASKKFFDVALYAYTLYGVTITPAMICALLLPKIRPRAVVCGMSAGLVFALIWKALIDLPPIDSPILPTAMLDIDAVLPALLVNVLTIVLVQRFAPGKAGPGVKMSG